MTGSSQRDRSRDGEAGYALLFTAVTMIGMMLFLALVIDVGQVMLHRRQDQAAADTAVLAGAMVRYDEAALKTTVVDLLNANLPSGNFTTADLNTCASEPLPSGWSTYPTANCLAHDSYWTELRLRIPTRSVDTAFARVGGITTIEHTAFAEARVARSVTVLPFAVPSNADGHQCLKVGNSSLPDNLCDQNIQGNFGDLDFTQWGNPIYGTTTDCTGTTAQYADNLAQGVDHGLYQYTGGATTEAGLSADPAFVDDDTNCPWKQPRANGAPTGNGNQPNVVGKGLFGDPGDFPDGGAGRLRRLSSLSWTTTTTVGGDPVDDTPLWEFIDPTLTVLDDVPRSCWKNQFIGDAGALNWDDDLLMTAVPKDIADYLLIHNTFTRGERTIKMMERCLSHYRGEAWTDHGNFAGSDTHFPTGCLTIINTKNVCTDPIFTRDSVVEPFDIYDIQTSPRFVFVPATPAWQNLGMSVVAFERFQPLFIQRVYASGDIFDPGVGFNANPTGNKAEALTAFVLPAMSLPRGLGNANAPNTAGTNVFMELSR
ncbi:MAG: pilus assembly protein TadG-related protein [Acidimicrobiales bacterium]